MMKKICVIVLFFSLALFGCIEERIIYPSVPNESDGLNGLNGEESYVFEYAFDFTAPEYSALLELPVDFHMLDTDVMLVYLLWEVLDDGTELWRLAPQTLYLANGSLSYNYDFTKLNAKIFLDGTINLNTLGADYTDNWISRVVVVPGQFGSRTTLDYSDYDQVKKFYNLPDAKFVTRGYTKNLTHLGRRKLNSDRIFITP